VNAVVLAAIFLGSHEPQLAQDPADRPQSAWEVVEAIEVLEYGETAEEVEVCSPEGFALRAPPLKWSR